MTYRELTMMDVKELLRRWAAGHSSRKIARETGTDRGTVSRYIAMAEALGLSRDRELTDDACWRARESAEN
jgi:response regulator of citrate/malate metabolism